jgi:hypothetical protein
MLAVLTAQNIYLGRNEVVYFDQRHDVITADKTDVPCSIISQKEKSGAGTLQLTLKTLVWDIQQGRLVSGHVPRLYQEKVHKA